MSAYRDAQLHDAPYAAARAARDAGLEQLPQGRAGLLPNVSLNASVASNRQESQLRYPGAQMLSSHYSSTSWAIQLTQPVFRWQNWVSYTQAELATAAAELQWVYAGQDLILRVAQSYFDVLSAQDALVTVQSQKQAIGEQLDAVKKGFKYGAATITDVHEAQSRYDLALAQEISARSALSLRKRVLRTLTGKNADKVKTLRAGVLLAPPAPEKIDPWIESAEAGNLKVQLGQNTLEIATREIEK
ncbi:MAG: TolC family protein, partial [Candidatus Accumulibacter sp.]|nr:TolC family protein [Accumulibacter sp.]